MAIDSRNKRASALNSVPIIVAPLADGTIDDNDRQQITWLYAGIVAGIPVVIVILTPADRTLKVPYTSRKYLVAVDSRSLRAGPETRKVIA